MTAYDDLDRQLNDFLRDGPDELPYESFDAVRDRTEHTGQRVVIGPWRLPEMNKFVTIGLSAAALVIVVVVGAQLLGAPEGGVGSDPPEASEPIASPESSATPEPTEAAEPVPPLTAGFTSTLHGYSLSYPEGWTTVAATQPWTDPTFPLSFEIPQVDFLYDPVHESDLFLAIASRSIGETAPEDWVTEQMAGEEGCGTVTEATEVDAANGLIGPGECTVAVVSTAGRGYWIQLYTGSEAPEIDAPALFRTVLGTVQLHPEDAIDTAPSPSP